MAEASMFSVASKLLSTVSSPAFEKAYERVCSIWDAKDELNKLKRSIQTIHVVLLDAEKKQDSSAAVKDWIKRVRDVLYEAEDLFDEVATDHMLKQQIIKGGNKILSKGWWRKAASTSTIGEGAITLHHHHPLFPSLWSLNISSCPEVKSIPLCPRLERLSFEENVGIQELMESVRSNTSSLLRLKEICIRFCNELSIQVEALPTLMSLSIEYCKELKNLHIAHLTALEELKISRCPQMELWEEDEEKRCHIDIDWDSLPNLREITSDKVILPERLPESLLCRHSLGKLQLTTKEPWLI